MILYHWSPRERRKQIERYGLRPGSRSHSFPEFRPPYICLAENPAWAWALSGDMYPESGLWDLWQAHLSNDYKIRRISNNIPREDRRWKEVRVYDRIYKRGVIWIAERSV